MTDVAVVGAGVVGLACAAELARRGLGVTVVEQNSRIAAETSTRNSGVIHAGLYDRPGSLKAVLAVEGRERLYARCARWQIPHRRVGKLVVATTPDEAVALEAVFRRGNENGAGALALLDGPALRRVEPRVRACLGLWSPETGIVDPFALAQSYQAEAEQHGAVLVLRTRVLTVTTNANGFLLDTVGADGTRCAFPCEVVVNAAGLGALELARSVGREALVRGRRLQLCKGDYFAVAPACGVLAQHLVYPVPSRQGLGIHVTMDLGGQFRLGPDAEDVAVPSYQVAATKAVQFAAAVARYLPGLSANDLRPDYAGLRPRLAPAPVAGADFVLESGESLGLSGYLQLLGVESPGLTAAGAIARRAADLLLGGGSV